MNVIPKDFTKDVHREINKDRRYEVDEIASNCSGDPETVIPKDYWEDFKDRTAGL